MSCDIENMGCFSSRSDKRIPFSAKEFESGNPIQGMTLIEAYVESSNGIVVLQFDSTDLTGSRIDNIDDVLGTFQALFTKEDLQIIGEGSFTCEFVYTVSSETNSFKVRFYVG